MVASVYGKCDGRTIIFSENKKTGRWEAAVPFDQDGEYVVELTAVDDCGNESYYATLLFVVDTNKLCVTVKILRLSAQARKDKAFKEKVKASNFSAQVKKDGTYKEKVKINKWRTKIVRCELCGRF